MTHKLFLFFLTICCLSCKSPEARKPVTVKTGSFISESAERNIELKDKETSQIKEELNKFPNKTIIASNYGFWYFYTNTNSTNDYKAEFGDKINFTYNIKSINGNTIYSTQELGEQTYFMDKAELFTGLREALKLLKEGQSATFFFPSQKAFGYYGDENKISTNVPIRCDITINSITKIQQ